MAFIRRVDVPGASQAHGPISRCLGGPLMIEIVSSSSSIGSADCCLPSFLYPTVRGSLWSPNRESS